MMRLICADQRIVYDAQKSVTDLAEQTGQLVDGSDKIFPIVALMDGNKLGFRKGTNFFDEDFAATLSREMGVPVRIEQLCVPPVSILLSDIVFHDFFMPRDADGKYQPFSSIIKKIKRASMVLIDDEEAFRLRDCCVYPRLSLRFTQDPQTDLLARRLAIYTRNHHLLAREVVPGKDIPLESITESIRQLGAYLGVPVMTLAFHGRFQNYTQNWDYTKYGDYTKDIDCQLIDRVKIQASIHGFIRARKTEMRLQPGRVVETVTLAEQPHFCSFLINQAAVDFVTARYENFCIGGLPSSLPYLEKRLKQLNKPYRFSTTLNPDRDDLECMMFTGFFGAVRSTKPYYDFMHVGDEAGNGDQGGRPHNVSPEIEEACPSLVSGSPDLTDAFLQTYGATPVGNFVLNQEASIRTAVAQNIPDLFGFWNAYFFGWYRYTLGLVYMENGNFLKAGEQLSRCIATSPPVSVQTKTGSGLRWAGPRHALASCLVTLGPEIRADQKFIEALLHSAKPSRNLRFDYALFQAQIHRAVEALNSLFYLVTENPLDVEAWLEGGKIALNRPDFNEVALDWTKEALGHHPENEELKRQRVKALNPAAHYGNQNSRQSSSPSYLSGTARSGKNRTIRSRASV